MFQFDLLLLGGVPLLATPLSTEDLECLGTKITESRAGTGTPRDRDRRVKTEKLTGQERHSFMTEREREIWRTVSED